MSTNERSDAEKPRCGAIHPGGYECEYDAGHDGRHSAFIDDFDEEGPIPPLDWTDEPKSTVGRAGASEPTLRHNERVARHPNGHLVIEALPAVPSDEQIAAKLASLSKAWPILAKHADHIDGEFDNALSDVRRFFERFKSEVAALRAALTASQTRVERQDRMIAETGKILAELADARSTLEARTRERDAARGFAEHVTSCLACGARTYCWCDEGAALLAAARPTPERAEPRKGELGGECNRTACHRSPANWFNTSTRKHYCQPCAFKINDANGPICDTGDERVSATNPDHPAACSCSQCRYGAFIAGFPDRAEALSRAWLMCWQSADTAPRTGEHILVTQIGERGFGICGGDWQDWCAVVHYWPNPGEEGFYLSAGASAPIDDHPIRFTHWMPLPAGEGVQFGSRPTPPHPERTET